MHPLRLGIMGPSNSGKDHAAEWLVANTCLLYQGTTSVVISRRIAEEEGISFGEAHAQRHARKAHWRAKGDELRRDDPAALARVVVVGPNLIVGIRARCEILAVRRERMLDVIYWVDRPGQEADVTLEFGPEECHAVIQNHWGVAEYDERLRAIAQSLGILNSPPGGTPGGRAS